MKLRYIWISALCLLAACSEKPAQPKPASEAVPAIRLTLLPQDTLEPGKPVAVLAKLNNIKERTIITPDQLQAVNGEKFRLLLIDPTLTDYQQLYPQPTSTPGVFSFTFTPELPGGYRAWADVTLANGKQQFAISEELGARSLGVVNRSESYEADTDGYHFALSFDKPPMAGNESIGTIAVTRDGSTVTPQSVEITGFYDDFRTVIHIYAGARTPLAFHLIPPKAGFIKLFVQARIGVRELSAPFGIRIGKAE